MSDCIFCRIASGEIPCYKVYEDNHVIAFFDINPANAYHTLVIPKQHYENIFDIPEHELQHIMHAIKKIATLYQQKLGIENIQIINNSGKEAQQEVMHIHFHLVPRQTGDGQDRSRITKPELRERFEELLTNLKKENQ